MCKVSYLYILFTVFEIQGFKLKKKKKKNWEDEHFVLSPLLGMQFLPYLRYTCMLHVATILW